MGLCLCHHCRQQFCLYIYYANTFHNLFLIELCRLLNEILRQYRYSMGVARPDTLMH